MARRLASRAALFFVALIGAEVAYVLLRPAPLLPEFDPSGEFGDPSQPTIRVAVLGDSSVTAPGVSHPDETWIRLAARRLAETRHVILESQAVGGSKATDVRNGQLDAAIAFAPDVAIISVGANDAIRGVPLRRFEADLDPTVAALRESGAAVVLSGVGGLGTIFGPVVGASVYAVLQDTVMRQTEYWRALLGVIILVLVLAFPQGIAGALSTLTRKLTRKSGGAT